MAGARTSTKAEAVLVMRLPAGEVAVTTTVLVKSAVTLLMEQVYSRKPPETGRTEIVVSQSGTRASVTVSGWRTRSPVLDSWMVKVTVSPYGMN